jgi:hypothetical protein
VVVAVGIRSPQAGTLVAFRQSAHEEHVPQFTALVAYNVPSLTLAAPQANIAVAFHQAATVAVEQARIYAAVRGRVANPSRASLDVHARRARFLRAAARRHRNARL